MDRDFIIEQMKVFAAETGTKAIGRIAFEKATGIKQSDWLGKYWSKWSDATSEAGLSSGEMQSSYDKNFVAEKLIALIRELGKFPTNAEIKLNARACLPKVGTGFGTKTRVKTKT